MIFIPSDIVVFKGLNSYYLDLRKLLEHQQGEVGSGGLHLNSNTIEGAIFFDKDELLTGILDTHEDHDSGIEVVDRLIDAAEEYNFTINIYAIDTQKVYYWANLPNAETIYKNLTSEFSSLERLVATMGNNRLTGYIDISFGQERENGYIFFHQGDIIGSFYSSGSRKFDTSNKNVDLIIRKSEASESTFDVRRIFSSKMGSEGHETQEKVPFKNGTAPSGIASMLQELIATCESFYSANKKNTERFEIALRKKFIKYADIYPFLDPFSGEFEYSAGRVSLVGDAEDDELARGVLVSLRDFFHERGLQSQFADLLTKWAGKFRSEIEQLEIQL